MGLIVAWLSLVWVLVLGTLLGYFTLYVLLGILAVLLLVTLALVVRVMSL